MSKIIELQAKMDALLKDQRAMALSSPDKPHENWQKSVEERTALAEQIKYARETEAVEKLSLEMSKETTDAKPEIRTMTYSDTFWKYLSRSATQVMLPEEMRLLETRGTNTQKTSTDSLGGFAVPQELHAAIQAVMKYTGGMFEACRLWNSAAGGTFRWPTGNDTGATGAITAQASDATVLDTSIGQVTFGDYAIDSNIMKVTEEMIQDDGAGFQQYILDSLVKRVYRKANTVLTNGTGTAEPYGLTVACTSTGMTTSSATAITGSELIKHVHKVDREYRFGENVGWMMNDETMGYLRTLDVTTNTTHLFVDTILDGRVETRLLGYKIFINNDLPALTNGLPVTATKHIWFGDFSNYIIRQVRPLSIDRTDHLYWASRTIGFKGWLRLDGNCVDQSAIKALLQA